MMNFLLLEKYLPYYGQRGPDPDDSMLIDEKIMYVTRDTMLF